MYLLYCDETNLEERNGVFFVYGGVAVPVESVQSLSQEIDNLREEYGISTDFILKFNPGPEGISHQQFIELKQSIIEVALRNGCKLFTSFILHDLATSPNDARRNEINRICYHFHCFLNRCDTSGLVLIDRFSDNEIDHHLREKFSVGIRGLPYCGDMRLERIVGFHYAAIGQSHMCSVVDIILGSLRFAINAGVSQNEEHLETANAILEILSPLFFKEENMTSISEIGMFFSPKIIRVQRYREKYESLRTFITDAGLDVEQVITAERRY